MEDLAKQQLVSAGKIEKALSNFKKDGPARRTVDYIQTRLDRLESEWRYFDSRDIQMQELRTENPGHSYFAERFYDQAERIYVEFRSMLLSAFEAVDSTEQQQKQPVAASGPQQRQIRQLKAVTTVLQSLLTELEDELSATQSPAFYRQKLYSIQEHWVRITSLYLDIMSEEQCRDYEPESFTRLDKQTQGMLIRLQEKLDDQAAQQVSSQSIPNSSTGCNTNHGHMKLPKITLPIFSGSYLQWTQFYNLYVELIHHQRISKCKEPAKDRTFRSPHPWSPIFATQCTLRSPHPWPLFFCYRVYYSAAICLFGVTACEAVRVVVKSTTHEDREAVFVYKNKHARLITLA